MKIQPLIVLLFATFCTYAQKIPDVGMNVRINEGTKTIVAEIKPVNGTPTMDAANTYYWYGSGLIRHTQGGYSGRLLNGIYKEYFLNKNLKEQGSFRDGLKTGTWKSWTDAGVLKELVTYRSGIRQGAFALYDEVGKPTQSGNYDHNELDGKITFYSRDSTSVIVYKDGKQQPKKPNSKFWNKLNIFKKHQKKASAAQPKVKP